MRKIMKYTVLLLFTIMVGTCSAASTADIDKFKYELYCSQVSLMGNRAAYYVFIQPYIEEAKRTLKLVQCDHADKSFRSSYFGCLLNYNISCFNTTYVSSKGNLPIFQKVTRELRDLIEKGKKELAIDDMNVEEEFKKTTELFQRANRAYYKQLGLMKKCSIKTSCWVRALDPYR